MLKVIFYIGILVSVSVANAKELSLKEVRSKLFGQDVLILGNTFIQHGESSSSLVDWYLVKGDETAGFTKLPMLKDGVPATIKGKRGQVISVEESRTSLRPSKIGQIDAFGKPIDDSQVTNPYLRVIVRMKDDGLLIGTTNYFINMVGNSFQLVSRMDAIGVEVNRNIAGLVGRKLYKTGYTKLLDSALSIEDLSDPEKRDLSIDYETKNLTPLKVVDAKFIEGENALVIKVELPDRSTRLLFGDLRFYDMEVGYKQTKLDRMQVSAVEKIPGTFSPREIAAIKESKIFRGMSEDALYWSWGYAEKTNDWGRGGKQHIYHRNQYVYVKEKIVYDWQSTR